MYILGSNCSITMIAKATAFPIPYTLETIREKTANITLASLIDKNMKSVKINTGTTVSGCFVTLLNDQNIVFLFSLITSSTAITIHLNRLVEKRKYENLQIVGWELRGNRDATIYLRFDLTGSEAAEWDQNTLDLPWEQTPVYAFHDGDIALDGEKSDNIYRFALTSTLEPQLETILQLHYPLKEGDTPNNRRHFDIITLTFENTLLITLLNVNLLEFAANTDNAEEILVVRQYRVDGEETFEVRNAEGVWEVPE